MGGITSEIYFFPHNVTLILLYKIKSEGEIDNWYYVLNFPLRGLKKTITNYSYGGNNNLTRRGEGGGVGGDGRGLFYVILEPRTYKKKNNLSSSPFVSLHTVTSITDLLDALRPPFRNCDGLKSYWGISLSDMNSQAKTSKNKLSITYKRASFRWLSIDKPKPYKK